MRQQSRRRIVPGAILLVGLGSIALNLGAGTTAAHTSAAAITRHPTPSHGSVTDHATAGAMTGMRMTGPNALAASGTVVRLHQRLVRVTIYNFAFGPARLVVSPGTRIVWTNQDSDPHTVDSTKNLWASDALDTGNQFARVFKTPGAFSYYCSIHPYMHGTIIVKK